MLNYYKSIINIPSETPRILWDNQKPMFQKWHGSALLVLDPKGSHGKVICSILVFSWKNWIICIQLLLKDCINPSHRQQPSRDVLKKKCCENMQQIYKRTPMPKCDFNKNAYWNKNFNSNRTSACVFSCKYAGYFQKTFLKKCLWRTASYVTGLFLYPLKTSETSG